MSFKKLNISGQYRSGKNDIVKDFYIPVLEEATLYKRAVGYFSSSALIELTYGLMAFIKNGGKIQLVVSPRLSLEDIEAIDMGYKEREDVIGDAIVRDFTTPKTIFEEERLNLLSHMIAMGTLDIKVAFLSKNNTTGLYHEKLGLFYDNEGNIISFFGSGNETANGFKVNYESFDVVRSWSLDNYEKDKAYEKESNFDEIWYNNDSLLETIDFPQIAIDELKKYQKPEIDEDIDIKEFNFSHIIKHDDKNAFRKPEWVNFYKYQQEAIDSWIGNDGVGIFDMATGSGKTYTALGALCALTNKLNDELPVIIVCPYQHLVEQWVEDIRNFNVEPLVCYSKYNWKTKFKYLISDYELGVKKRFCIIMTNASYSSEYAQQILRNAKGNFCIVVDEAHNFGAEQMKRCLLDNFKYRLALSATIERHNDEEGTRALLDYFGEKCIEFTLKDAIDNDFLTHYVYKPVVVYLTENELIEYVELSKKIGAMLCKNKKKNNGELPKNVETLLIKRARIIAGAHNKVSKLEEVIEPYKEKSNILVYCGATKYDSEECEEDIRQIEAVTDLLGNKLGMRVTMFTSLEKPDEREQIKKSFSEGAMLQAIVAIKCLDEGVNIPGISTAFILASSTNPKEYIQRRGRVLRKAPGKKMAEIFDFVTLPSPNIENIESDLKYIKALIKREFDRMEDFMEYCDNKAETVRLMDEIKQQYKLYEIGEENYEYL